VAWAKEDLMQWNENLKTADELVKMAKSMDPTLRNAEFEVREDSKICSWHFRATPGIQNEEAINSLLRPVWIRLVILYELTR
jgi:hypothetical protein